MIGPDRLAWFWHAITRNYRSQQKFHPIEIRLVPINGELGIAYYGADGLLSLMAFETDGERVHSIYVIRNPDKLRAFATAATSSSPVTASESASSSE
jgi:RNA polymerase sigma-70 factor, ECF subfamily